MAVTYESGSEYNGAASMSHAVPAPPGVVNKNLLVGVFFVADTATTLTLPNGWTELESIGPDAPMREGSIAWKVAEASEPSTYTISLDTSKPMAGGIARFSSAASVETAAESGPGFVGGQTESATADDALLAVRVVFAANDNQSPSLDGGITEIVNEEINDALDITILMGVDDTSYNTDDAVPKQGWSGIGTTCHTFTLFVDQAPSGGVGTQGYRLQLELGLQCFTG